MDIDYLTIDGIQETPWTQKGKKMKSWSGNSNRRVYIKRTLEDRIFHNKSRLHEYILKYRVKYIFLPFYIWKTSAKFNAWSTDTVDEIINGLKDDRKYKKKKNLSRNQTAIKNKVLIKPYKKGKENYDWITRSWNWSWNCYYRCRSWYRKSI